MSTQKWKFSNAVLLTCILGGLLWWMLFELMVAIAEGIGYA